MKKHPPKMLYSQTTKRIRKNDSPSLSQIIKNHNVLAEACESSGLVVKHIKHREEFGDRQQVLDLLRKL